MRLWIFLQYKCASIWPASSQFQGEIGQTPIHMLLFKFSYVKRRQHCEVYKDKPQDKTRAHCTAFNLVGRRPRRTAQDLYEDERGVPEGELKETAIGLIFRSLCWNVSYCIGREQRHKETQNSLGKKGKHLDFHSFPLLVLIEKSIYC